MKYENPWPPVEPQDEDRYDIELRDGTIVEDVEYWAFGDGFDPIEKQSSLSGLTRYPLSQIVSFSPSNTKVD